MVSETPCAGEAPAPPDDARLSPQRTKRAVQNIRQAALMLMLGMTPELRLELFARLPGRTVQEIEDAAAHLRELDEFGVRLRAALKEAKAKAESLRRRDSRWRRKAGAR